MIEFLQLKPEMEPEKPINDDILRHAGLDRLRLLLIYILCSENLKEDDIKEKYHIMLNFISKLKKTLPNLTRNKNISFELLVTSINKAKPLLKECPSKSVRSENKSYITRISNSKDDAEDKYIKHIRNLTQRNSSLEKHVNFLKTKMGSTVYQKKDLEEIFKNCINVVKKNIYQRRLHLKTINNVGITFMNPILKEDITKNITNTVKKIKNSINKNPKIKFSEFTNEDKMNLLTLFVCNDRIVQYIYNFLFPRHENDLLYTTYCDTLQPSLEVKSNKQPNMNKKMYDSYLQSKDLFVNTEVSQNSVYSRIKSQYEDQI